jgi:antitoxin (DNA-binding transcriptional repressor) of toxin-antitoxin stability system
MDTVTLKKAKTQLSRLIAKACRGEDVIIARGNQPVVKRVALPVPRKGLRIPGAWKGKIFYTPDASNPLTEPELKDECFE